jgi:hypothetical protein
VIVLDPTSVAFGKHIRSGENGILISETEDGQFVINLLHLNDNPALQVRQKYLRILELRDKLPSDPDVEKLFLDAFGFPDDMPDLRTKRPPGDNTKPGSEQTCYFARRERKELPETY